MTWRPATEQPSRADRYPVRVETGTLITGSWTPERGWTDGITKINHVWLWFDLPPVPSRGKGR